MGSMHLDLERGAELNWPPACAMCGNHAEDWALASVSTSEKVGYYVVVVKWTKKSLSLSYPVCRKHKVWCNLLDRPARWGFIDSFIWLLAIPLLVWLAIALPAGMVLGAERIGPYVNPLGAILLVAMILFYFAARFIKPVRLSGLHKAKLVISIRDDAYFARFAELNPPSPTV